MKNRLESQEEFILYQNDAKSSFEHVSEEPSIRLCTGASCIASGALEVKEKLESFISDHGLSVPVYETGCMGPCSRGPVLKIHPENIVYEAVTAEEAEKIVLEHFASSPDAGEEHVTSAPAFLEDFFKQQQKIVLRNCGRINPLDINEYCAVDGYSALVRCITSLSADEIIDIMKDAGLRGRGGAGFPTWLKWNFTRKSSLESDTAFVLCNADEGDPGAFMDRSVLEGDPHSLIEGMAIAAYTVGASRGFVYVRAEYPLAVSRLTKAIEQARELGLLGEHILGTDFSFDLEIRMGSGAFVCGEETALMNSIEGKRGEPRPRPPFPAHKGLWDKPSLLNNVETYANVPAILLNGPDWYAEFGTEKSTGTKVFALAGAVKNTGLVEVQVGTTLGELIFDIGGGIKNGKEFKAAQIGGPSGGCIPKEHLNVPLDYESVTKLGAIMGSGGLIVMDEDTCMVDVARFFIEFVQEESCGKCTPCRVGTKRMLEILERICSGQGMEGDIEKLIELGEMIKESSLCGLGQTAPNPVLSTIRYFRHEYEEHILQKKCSAGVCPSLVRAPCQSCCPAGVDIPGFVSLIGEKRYAEALKLHRERNPFASVCARICFHTCEDKCRRGSLDEPVSIRGIKRFMADQEIIVQVPETRDIAENAKRKIAIIGAGPAGLSCGYFLARLGYRPVIFEKEMRPGGMMVQTIPAYRLPRETLAKEIRMIEHLGVEIRTQQELGKDITLTSLHDEGYESIFFGIGAAHGAPMGIPGENLQGVVQGTDFLRQYNIRGAVPVGKKVIVIGGGNAAIDAARTALRLGADVTVVYRRTRNQMPAYAEEIEEAINEGVHLECLVQPVEITGKDVVSGLKCIHMKLAEFDRSGRRRPREIDNDMVTFECDQVIIAIGQNIHASEFRDIPELQMTQAGFIHADSLTGQTSVPWLFAGGDAGRGPSSVVQAIADGERGAYGIDLMLTGESHAFWREEKYVDTEFDPDADPVSYPREKIRTSDVMRRRHNFDEVEMPWIESVALRECRRCLRCDYGKVISESKEAQHV